MAEQVDLTTPIDRGTISNYQVGALLLDRQASRIDIRLFDPGTGETANFSYEGQIALDLMIALNKLDLSTTSLHKRIMNRLIADGKIDGTVSGTPE